MLTNEVNPKDALGLNAQYLKAVEDSDWAVANVAVDYEWVDGKRTDTKTGVKWLLIGPRVGNSLVRNKQITITDSNVMSLTDIEDINNDENGVTVKVKDLHLESLWASSSEGSTYANINFRLGGVVVINGGK